MAELVVRRVVDAPQQRVWAALTDWDAHDRWMLLTSARGGHGEGARVEAFTGVGRVGFLDTMQITVWQPPERAVVRHTGRVVRGSGSFEVRAVGPHRSEVVWSEWLLLPFGVLGRLAWPVVRPGVRAGVASSLRRLARRLEPVR